MRNPFFTRFPYTNLNDINLDWIIKKVKALQTRVDNLDPEDLTERLDEIQEMAEQAGTDAETALETANNKVSKDGDTMTGVLRVRRNVNTGTGIVIQSDSLTDGVVVSSLNWGTLFDFYDSKNTIIGMFHPVFRTDGKQGVEFRSRRYLDGTNKDTYFEIGKDSASNSYVILESPAAWCDALGLKTVTEQRFSGDFFRAVRKGNMVLFTCLVGTWTSDANGRLSVDIGGTTITPQLNASMRPLLSLTLREANMNTRVNIGTDGYFSVPTASPVTGAALRFSACWIAAD